MVIKYLKEYLIILKIHLKPKKKKRKKDKK